MIIYRKFESSNRIEIYQYNTKTHMERMIWCDYDIVLKDEKWEKYITPIPLSKEKRISKSKAKELMFLESL